MISGTIRNMPASITAPFRNTRLILSLLIVGVLAYLFWTGSRYPDLIIGLVIGLVVLNGARKILRLKD